MANTLTKPVPPPPKFPGLKRPAPPRVEQVVDYQDILRRAGYPLELVLLDWETYFDDEYSMQGGEQLSTIEYIMDPRFEELGVSVLAMPSHCPDKDYEEGTMWFDGEEGVSTVLRNLRHVYGPNLERCTIIMQNARFDAGILAFRHGIYPPYIIDTLGLARHWDSRTRNSLGALTARYNLVEKGDTKQFKGLTNKRRFKKSKGRKKGPQLPVSAPLMTPEQKTDLAAYANNDVMREWEIFKILLPKLSRPEIELPLIHHTLDMFFHPRLHIDREKATELIAAMEQRIEDALSKTGLTAQKIRGRFFDEHMYGLLKASTSSPAPADYYIKSAKNKPGWKIASAASDTQREELLTHPDENIRNLMAAKEALHSWPNHIKRVKRIVTQANATQTGCLPVPFKYHGAHTGRWAGDEKINLQNLGERNPEPLIRAVRELLVAPPHQQLVIADLSAIEARGTAWVAGQEDLLQKFRDLDANPDAVTDVYTDFASYVLGWAVRKPKKSGGIPAIEKKMKWGRNSIGKVGILGCGYGMGPDKTVGFSGNTIDYDTAKAIVENYRKINDKIVQFWKDVERAFLYTFKYKRPCEMPRGVRFESREDCDVVCILPTDREIKYHNIRTVQGRWGEELQLYSPREHSWSKVWGGHFTENIVQGFCRDILAEALLRVEARGVPVVLHVHDELVAAEDTEKSQEALSTMIEELTRPLPWAPDFPLAAEGLVTSRYGGH